MKKKANSIRKIAWGLFLIGAAAIIVANAYYSFTNLIPLLCGILLVPIIIESIIHLNFSGIFMSAALVGIIFAKQLGIEAITPWPILAVAVLLSIGFSLLFRQKKWLSINTKFSENETYEDIDDDEMTCNVRFGAGTKYIRSENFENAYLNCSFGAIKAYFDNAKMSPNGAQIHINAQFSGIELYIPKTWRVVSSVSCILGGLDEITRNVPTSDSPILNITGEVKFSGVEIYYI